VIFLDTDDLISARELYRLQQISFWDALIVRAARKEAAFLLYTEDMKRGTVYGRRAD
jgi:predicted nucleic acid-binding protein